MRRLGQLALIIAMATCLNACQSKSRAAQEKLEKVAAESGMPEEVAKKIKATLAKDYPGMTIQSVKPASIQGLYEVLVDGDVVYMDGTARYVMMGHLIDIKTRENLTEKALQSVAKEAWSTLPFQAALKEVRGDGKRQLVLFSDPDCPFCRKVEMTLKELDNVTIYTFLTPIEELHPDSMRKSKAIWCSDDRLKSWLGYMRESQPLPELKANCDAPEMTWAKLQKQFKVRATPTLLFSDGKIIPGAVDKATIEKTLEIALKKASAK